MKKILTILTLIVITLFSNGSVQAQGVFIPDGCTYSATDGSTYCPGSQSAEAAACASINATNYPTCCKGTPPGTPNYINQCDSYSKGLAAGGGGSSTPGTTPATGAGTTTPRSCKPVFSDTYTACCVNTTGNEAACTAYCSSAAGEDSKCPRLSTQTGGGGTQPSGAVNGTSNLSGYNLTSGSSGSTELLTCDTIKFNSIFDMLIWVKCIIVSAIIPLMFTFAFLYFLWGVIRFIMATDKTKKEESKKFIMWGMIGLFVMLSVWGIIKILGTTLGVDSTTVPLLQTDYLSVDKATKKK